MKIAHISDLHFRSAWTWPPPERQREAEWALRLSALKADLARHQPDLFVVTGDIADNSAWELTEDTLVLAWTNALNFFEDIVGVKASAALAERLFVIPGNHDAKVLGNISREQLKSLATAKPFRMARWGLKQATKFGLRWYQQGDLYETLAPFFDRRLQDALQSVPSDSKRFNDVFGSYMQSRAALDGRVLVFCVDSNIGEDSLLNFAQGAVSPTQVASLRTTSEQWRSQYQDYTSRYKFLLMHHHPMPLPFAEGLGARFEGEEFLLLRNAGSFLQECAAAGVDFILHGHKHAPGCSVVSFPELSTESAPPRTLVVVAAGSAQYPLASRCHYNLLTQAEDGSWTLEVQVKEVRDGTNNPYKPTPAIAVRTTANHRERLSANKSFDILAERADVLARIDDDGDLEVHFYVKGVRPRTHGGEVSKYPVLFANESKRATLEATGFEDRNDKPNVVEGDVIINPPARAGQPRDIEFSVKGTGLYTFSREYCRVYKNLRRERLGFTTRKTFGELYIEIEFPAGFWPTMPVVEAATEVRKSSEREMPMEKLIEQGYFKVDSVESRLATTGLRVWKSSNRVAILISRPLPDTNYSLVWELPETEFDVLPGPDQHGISVRADVRQAVSTLRSRFLMLPETPERRDRVRAFLDRCGQVFIEHFKVEEMIRIDVAVERGNKLSVVEGRQRTSDGWVVSALRPECELGETLRGKAYLQRVARFYTPKVEESRKDPQRHPSERETRHQIAVPLLVPLENIGDPDLEESGLLLHPFCPRVGVVTFSSEAETSAFDGTILRSNVVTDNLLWLLGKMHYELREVAADLGTPLPSVTP